MRHRYKRGDRVRFVREFLGVPVGTNGEVIEIDAQDWHLTYRVRLETTPLPVLLWAPDDAIEPGVTISINPDIDLSEVL